MQAKTQIKISATDQTKRAFKSVSHSMGAMNKNISGMHASLGALLGVGGMGLLIKRSIEAGDKIGKLSTRLGASTEALSQYRHVAELSGVSFETLTMGWQRMTRRVAEAAKGTGEAKNALIELNLSAKALNQLAPEKQFEVLAEAISKIENPADKVRLSMKLFDSEGVSLIQTMQGGAAGLREMRAEADELGLTIKQADAKAFAAMNDTMVKIKASVDGAGQSFVLAFGDSFANAVDYISNTAVPAFRFLAERIGLIDVNMTKLTRNEVLARMGMLQQQMVEVQERISTMAATGGLTPVNPGDIQKLKALGEEWGKLNAIINQKDDPAPGSASTRASGPGSETALTTLEQGLMSEEELLRFSHARRLQDQEVYNEQQRLLEETAAQAKLDVVHNSLLNLGTLMASDSKRVFQLGKAASLSAAVIQGHKSAIDAYAAGMSIGGPTAPAFAAAYRATSIAATAIQIASIAKTQFQGARALGGDVMPSNSYLVGERGPEIFTPKSGGTITANNNIGGATNTINVQVVATDADSFAGQLGRNANAVWNIIMDKMNENGMRFA